MGVKKVEIEELDFLTTSMIAKRVSRSTDTIRREIAAGRLKAKTFLGDYAITPQAFADWKAKFFQDV